MGEIKFQAEMPGDINFRMTINFSAREWGQIKDNLESLDYSKRDYPSRQLMEAIENLILRSKEHFSELVVDREGN